MTFLLLNFSRGLCYYWSWNGYAFYQSQQATTLKKGNGPDVRKSRPLLSVLLRIDPTTNVVESLLVGPISWLD